MISAQVLNDSYKSFGAIDARLRSACSPSSYRVTSSYYHYILHINIYIAKLVYISNNYSNDEVEETPLI